MTANAATASASTLARPATLRGQFSWALFEFANGPYFIVIGIFVFPSYFRTGVVGDNVEAQVYWGYIQAAAGIVIALFSPILGALADAAGSRKPGVALFSLLAVPAMMALWLATPGEIWTAAIAIMIAAVCMEFASVFHQAMLPSLISARRLGFVSGLGYGFNYIAAMFGLAVWLALPALGIVDADDPSSPHERSVGLLSAFWFVVFVMPFFLFTPDIVPTGRTLTQSTKHGLKTLGRTLSRVRHFRNIARFLVARMLYYDGMMAVFTFIGIYAGSVFGWDTELVSVYALLLIMTAALSAIVGGWVDDKIGSRRTILISIGFFAFGLFCTLGISPDRIFYFVPVGADLMTTQLPLAGPLLASVGFTLFPEQLSILCTMFGGLFAGPALASSRTMLARIAPLSMVTEFFGLYTLTGKATAFLAPLTIGIITQVTNNQRVGFAVIFVFLAAGFALMLGVREERTDAIH